MSKKKERKNYEENDFYNKCWSFICGESSSKLKILKNEEKYNSSPNNRLNNGDIVEVIIDREYGNLSFAINGVNYGIACKEIPKEDILYPVVNLFDIDQSIELVS